MKKFFQSLFSKDSDLNHIETAGGKLSLMGLFWPLLIETVLRNLMNTVNTVILSGYSDQAATAVGIALLLYAKKKGKDTELTPAKTETAEETTEETTETEETEESEEETE